MVISRQYQAREEYMRKEWEAHEAVKFLLNSARRGEKNLLLFFGIIISCNSRGYNKRRGEPWRYFTVNLILFDLYVLLGLEKNRGMINWAYFSFNTNKILIIKLREKS